MLGVALSLAEFALVEQQPSVSSPILMRGPRPWSRAQSSPTARREPADCRHSSRNRAHRGCEHGNRSGTARLSRLGNSSHRDPGCWRRACCNSRVRLAGSNEKVSGGKARGTRRAAPFLTACACSDGVSRTRNWFVSRASVAPETAGRFRVSPITARFAHRGRRINWRQLSPRDLLDNYAEQLRHP
jgi:hypothetical protein